jgi:hypothetical protein
LRAAAGEAIRAGVTSDGASLQKDDIVALARAAPSSPEDRQCFRQRLRCCHIEIAKDLWALDEAEGNGYELGNGLSDTYGLVCRAYRDNAESVPKAWARVFDPQRIERLKRLLDDLQTRLNSAGVTIVRKQLDDWCEQVPLRLEESGVPEEDKVREGLRRQTIIWRQLVAGDKEPEAYLDRNARAELQDELRALVWRRSRRFLAPVAGVLLLLVLAAPRLAEFYDAGFVKTGAVSVAVALAGALGITKASVVLTARSQVEEWTSLLWNRSVAYKVADKTCSLNEVWEPEPGRSAAALRGLGNDVVELVKRPASWGHGPSPS